jgi:hypothetical protein
MGVGGSGNNWDRIAKFEYNKGLEHELHAIIFILLLLVLKIISFQITSFPLFITICIPQLGINNALNQHVCRKEKRFITKEYIFEIIRILDHSHSFTYL